MDRHTLTLAGCGLMLLLASSGCKSTRSEVPPGRPYMSDGRQTPPGSTLFSSEPHPMAGNALSNTPGNLPGTPGGLPGTAGAAGDAGQHVGDAGRTARCDRPVRHARPRREHQLGGPDGPRVRTSRHLRGRPDAGVEPGRIADDALLRGRSESHALPVADLVPGYDGPIGGCPPARPEPVTGDLARGFDRPKVGIPDGSSISQVRDLDLNVPGHPGRDTPPPRGHPGRSGRGALRHDQVAAHPV